MTIIVNILSNHDTAGINNLNIHPNAGVYLNNTFPVRLLHPLSLQRQHFVLSLYITDKVHGIQL